MDLFRTYDRGRAALDRLLLSGTLRARAARGAVLLGGGSVAEQAVRFARNIVLTRLLVPSAFGAMAIVMSSSAIVGTLTDVGLRAAVIQNPRGAEKAYLDAGWWMGMFRAITTYAIIFAAAPWIARFYGLADLSSLLRVTLLGILFDGAMSPRSILAQKDMTFGRWTAISNGGAICGVILTVILSLIRRDVWALAIGFCSENGFRCLLSYILYPGFPSLRWNRQVIQELYRFSKAQFGVSFLNLISARADVFVLGKLYSATALGLYTMGTALILTPSTFFTGMLGQTLFPAFAHIQNDKERVNRILVEVTSWMILAGLPGVVVIYLCGHSLLSIMYGGRYVAAAGPLSVAAAVVFLTVLNAPITCALIGMGRPELHRHAVAASAIVMVLAIYPACKLLGVVGGQVAALLAIAASYAFQVLRMRDLTGLDLVCCGKSLGRAIVVSGGLLTVGFGAQYLGFATRPFANVALAVGSCAIAYALCIPTFLRIKQDSLGSL